MARTVLHIGVVLIAIGAVGNAQELPADRMDLEGFGKLPVRFNSRVTTIGKAAQNLLLQVSGRRLPTGTDGGKVDPVGWILDLAAGRPEALEVPIIRVEGEELLRLVRPGAKPRAETLISASEFMERYPELAEEARRARGVEPGERTSLDESLLKLMGSAWVVSDLKGTLEIVRRDQGDLASRLRELDWRLEQTPSPLFVPPEVAGSPWRALSRASIEVLGSEVLEGRTAGPVAKAMVNLIRAHAADDVGAFNKRLAEYRRLLEESGLGQSPIGYAVPDSWIEHGVPAVPKDWFYGDAGARGYRIAAFVIRGGDEKAWVNANHFPDGVPDRTRLVNQWRLQHGLPPVDVEGIEAISHPFPVAGRQARRLELTTPGSLPLPSKTTISMSLTHPAGMTEFSLYGPSSLVNAHKAEFEAFVGSLRLGEEAAIRAWLVAEPGVPTPDFGKSSFLGATVLWRGTLWAFRTTCTSDCVAEHRDQFIELVRSARFPFWSRTPIRLELPVGMREVRGRGFVYAEIVGDAAWDGPKHAHAISVEPIDAGDANCVPLLVNLWRGYLGLPAATGRELEKMILPLDSKDPSAGLLIEFHGPE